jgi:hypothetical protein
MDMTSFLAKKILAAETARAANDRHDGDERNRRCKRPGCDVYVKSVKMGVPSPTAGRARTSLTPRAGHLLD